MLGLMATLEYVRAHIDNLLIISKDSLEDHLTKLEVVLTRLQTAGLKVNAAKRESEWAFLFFISPKSNGTVRFISDFRELNKLLKRKPWPLPKIVETLQQLEVLTLQVCWT